MAATAHLKTQTHQPKPKRRKRREITISAAATAGPQPPVVSSDGTWCCPAAASSAPPKPAPVDSPPPLSASHRRATPPPPHEEPVAMDSPAPAYAPYPASYTKFNNALNAGLLNPMSPPPPPPLLDKTRSSPTLFEMMASEHDSLLHRPSPALHPPPPAFPSAKPPISHQDHQLLLRERVADILGSCSPGNQFNDPSSSDVKLTLSSKDGFSISLNVHRQILVAHSRFFASKLSDRSWPKHQQQQQQQHQHQHQHQHRPSPPYAIEISECDDVEIYLETLRLMYCKDIRRRLMREDVSKVLGILKVSAAITFDAGVLSCLEYLEAAPWAEDEEEKVASVLSQLHLDGAGAGEVLKRVSAEAGPAPEEREAHNGNGNEEILMRLLQVVLEGKDEKARRDMKGLVSKMLRESSSHTDLTKESLYSACDGCLRALRLHLLPGGDQARIARQADNLHWLLDILIDRQMGEEFLKTWAGEEDLAQAHSQVPAIHRYEVSRVTARLLVGIGKAQVLVSKEVRGLLLRTWLEPFYEDFGWMRRACKGLDRHLVEDGLSNTILTLPLGWQQDILLGWFDRFLNSGEDCPNIQRAFEVWWRRAFWRRHSEPDQPRQLRIVSASHNSC